jgi:hypothetical protein
MAFIHGRENCCFNDINALFYCSGININFLIKEEAYYVKS